MRWLTAALAVTVLISCASQAGPRILSVQVFEQRPRGQFPTTSVEGQHILRVRVQNQSEEAVSVDTISLRPFTSMIEFAGGDQVFQEVLEPGQAADFPMWITVTAQARTEIHTIDSVDVAITCHSTTRGTFTETGVHSVAVQ